jgi:hypothetical protein
MSHPRGYHELVPARPSSRTSLHLSLSFIVAAAAVYLVGLPLLTLVHEVGHAATAALLIGGRVTVVQGPAPPRFQLSIGQFDLRLRGIVAPHRVWVGWAFWEPHGNRRRHALATAAGPLASAACAAACAYGGLHTTGLLAELLWLLALGAGSQLLSTGLPVRYGRFFGSYAGEASDALRVRRILAGKPEPDPVAPRIGVAGG